MHEDPERERVTLPGLLAAAGAALLVASKLSDWFEAGYGLDAINLIFAVGLASTVVSFALAAGYDLLHSRLLQDHRPSRGTTTAALVALGIGALVVIGLEHLNHLPASDGWLGVAGGVLVLGAALANRHGRGRHWPFPWT